MIGCVVTNKSNTYSHVGEFNASMCILYAHTFVLLLSSIRIVVDSADFLLLCKHSCNLTLVSFNVTFCGKAQGFKHTEPTHLCLLIT